MCVVSEKTSLMVQADCTMSLSKLVKKWNISGQDGGVSEGGAAPRTARS